MGWSFMPKPENVKKYLTELYTFENKEKEGTSCAESTEPACHVQDERLVVEQAGSNS